MNTELSIHVSLAEVLGIVAMVVTFLVTRLADTDAAFRHLQSCKMVISRGFRSGKLNWTYHFYQTILALRTISILFAFAFFYFVFWHMYVLDSIVNSAEVLEIAHKQRLLILSEATKVTAVRLCMATCFAFILDWMLSLSAKWMYDQLKLERIPKHFHVNVIPKDWVNARAALWEDRIEEILATDEELTPSEKNGLASILENAEWRNSWVAWSRTVSTYRIHAMVNVKKGSEFHPDSRK